MAIHRQVVLSSTTSSFVVLGVILSFRVQIPGGSFRDRNQLPQAYPVTAQPNVSAKVDNSIELLEKYSSANVTKNQKLNSLASTVK
jgi:hypothetical protein